MRWSIDDFTVMAIIFIFMACGVGQQGLFRGNLEIEKELQCKKIEILLLCFEIVGCIGDFCFYNSN